MKKFIIFVNFCLTGLFISNCPAITLTGSVTDMSTGKNISSAVVSVNEQYQTKTNNNGIYVLDISYPGLYDVTFSKTGYQTLKVESIYLASYDNHELNVCLTTPGLLNIIAAKLPDTQTGQPYNNKIYISGGTFPYSFQVVSGALPPGLNLDPDTGNIFGTSQQQGAYNFIIGVNDNLAAYAEKDFSIIVTIPLTIQTEILPQATENENYVFSIQVRGGEQPYLFEVFNDLPIDLYLTQNGIINNVITKTINFNAGVLHHFWKTQNARISNKKLRLDSYSSIAEIELNCIDGTISFDYIYYLPCSIASLCGTFDFYIDNELVQSWYSDHSNSGSYETNVFLGKHIFKWTFYSKGSQDAYHALLDNISFPVDLQGDHYFNIKVTDTANRTTEKQLTLNVLAPFTITTTQLKNGIKDHSYNDFLSSSGGFGRIKWSVYAGKLPDGLKLSKDSGIISGTPVESSFETIIFEAIDENNNHIYKDLTIHIADVLQIETQSFPDSLIHENYSELIQVVGGIPPLDFQIAGQLPSGLTMNEHTGLLYGIPDEASYVNFKVIVSDSSTPDFQKYEKIFNLRTDNKFTITSSSHFPDIKQGFEINPIVLKASGGASMFSWSVIEKSLPQGILLNIKTGELTGTPLSYGTYRFSLSAVDQNGETATKEFYWFVISTLSIADDSIPKAFIDTHFNFALHANGGLKPYNWQIKTGVLPEGLFFDSRTGCIYGTPKHSEQKCFTVFVNDNDTPWQISDKQFCINVMKKTTIPGDIDNNYLVELQDLIILLKLIINVEHDQFINFDVNNNGQTGLEELIFIMNEITLN